MTELTDPTNAVIIERVFAASIDTCWAMWTDPAEFKAWYGPNGATIPVVEFDVRVGGKRRVCMLMNTPNGQLQMWFSGEHLVVDPPTRLGYSEAMTDEHGTILDPQEMGMPDSGHRVTEITVVLNDVNGSTHMTLTHAGIPAGSPGEFGWNMALNKLDEHLRNANDSIS